MAGKERFVRRTVLVVCEGKRDRAFIEFLRSLYTSGDPRSPKVDVRESRGKGANQVISTLVGILPTKQYDVGVAFTDADLPPSSARKRELFKRRRGFYPHLVQVQPCLEGLVLHILGKNVFVNSSDCKTAVEGMVSTDLFMPKHFEELLSHQLLESYLKTLPPHNDFYGFVEILASRPT